MCTPGVNSWSEESACSSNIIVDSLIFLFLLLMDSWNCVFKGERKRQIKELPKCVWSERTKVCVCV